MTLNKIRIGGIPAILWGEPGDRMILAAHGSHSSKIDDCMWTLAEEAVKRGYQVLSFDLPQHGERVYETGFIMPDQCVGELGAVYAYAKERAGAIALFGCSMGAYFQLLAFADAEIDRAWFLSPVTDMERIIHNLMGYCHITEEEFRERVLVENDIEPLYYPYYEYVRSHPIVKWPHKTYILRGEQDTLCEYARVKFFADRFGCELTEQQGGEHWFHTESQLAFFRAWIQRRL
jgi:pimeloyl-ACP methyl ester carboxylesterase